MRQDAAKLGLICTVVLALALSASSRVLAGEPLRFVYEPWSVQGGEEAVEAPAPRYGQEGFTSWAISYVAAYETEAFDQGLTLSYNRFLVDNIEWLLEAGLWSFYDTGNDTAFGLSAGFGFRWHFLTRERWTLFADAGISLLGVTDAVPPDGTELNFMPRVGVGFTYQIDEAVRVMGGVRWHHISNARTRGDDRNPSRDAPQFYVGLVVPF